MEHTLPPDLVTATAAVVGVTGLADGHLHVGPNAARWEKLERSLMDLLSVRTNLDGTLRTPLLLFQKLAREQNYPLRKMRMSLGTNTRGILKANWLHKHKVVLPGLLLMFFPFDPAEADWRERDALIVSEVQDRKRMLVDRSIRIVVVLVSVSEREDNRNGPDRVGLIRSSCGLDLRSTLFVYTANMPLRDFVVNLERVVFEHAFAYYREQAKRVKANKDKLPKGQVLELHVRYNFKIGVYADLRQEPKSAIKYFDAAYTTLLELIPTTSRQYPMRSTEIKMTAEYINYKLCKILLYTNAADAVTQFQRHVSTFIPLVGPNELVHEHWFFIAKQYRSFGELVETAIKVGAVSIEQIQHPGYYYQVAASYTGQRKLARALSFPKPLDAGVVALYEKADREFIGQPPKIRAHPLESGEDAHTIKSVEDEWTNYLDFSRDYESKVDHTALIIELLSRAYEQFKKYKSNRMTLSIAAQIAREYYDVKNYDMALRFFERISKTYRKEAWSNVLADILTISLKCALELNRVELVTEYSLELMSSKLGQSVEYRQAIQGDLVKSLQAGQLPAVVIDMEHSNAFAEIKAQFPDTAQIANKATPFRLIVHLNCPLPVTFSLIKITFSSPTPPIYLIDNNSTSPVDSALITATRGSDLVMVPLPAPSWDAARNANKLATNLFLAPSKVYVFEIPIDTKAVREIQCASVTAQMGPPDNAITLLFRTADRPSPVLTYTKLSPWNKINQLAEDAKKGDGSQGVYFDDFTEIAGLRVLPRKPQLAVSIAHKASLPVLLDEWFPFHVVIKNNEAKPISNVVASVEARLVAGSAEPRAYFAKDPGDLPQGKPSFNDLSLETPTSTLAPGESTSWPLNVRCPRAHGDRTIVVTLRYRVAVAGGDGDVDETVTIEETVPVVRAFHVATAMTPQQSILYAHQPLLEDLSWSTPTRSDLFYLSVAVRVASSPALCISSAALVPLSGQELEKRGVAVQVVSSGVENEGDSSVWYPSQVHNFMFRLKTVAKLSAPDAVIPLGFLQIKWRRKLENETDVDAIAASDSAMLYSVTKVQISSQERAKAPLNVVADIPASLSQGEPASIAITVRNETSRAEEVTVTIDSAEGCLLSGFKQKQMRMLPFTSHPVVFNIFPTQSGPLTLPLVRLLLVRRGNGSDAVQLIGPFTTFVEPAKALGF